MSESTFENDTSGGEWVIGFVREVEESHNHPDDTSDLNVRTKTRFSRHGDTLRAGRIVRFKDNTEHELTTDYAYDHRNGNLTGVTVSGMGETSRADGASEFIDSRYPGTLTNAAGHDEILTYDARFGLVKTLTDSNDRTTKLKYDAFGREIRRTTPDGVVISTAHHPCSVMTCAAVVTPADAGTESVTPVMRIEQTSIRGTTTIGPTTWRYLDKLGRTIRAEAQSFDGPARVRRDTRYDARGRARRASQPYYSGGTAHYTAYAYDARGRVLSETRPDRGVTTMAYVVDSANANQIRATATEEVYKPRLRRRRGDAGDVSLYKVMGELVSRTEGHGTADAAKTEIAYNGAGQPTTHTADGSVAATFDYDSAGFRESVTSPNFGTVTSTYTKFGELHARADGKGNDDLDLRRAGPADEAEGSGRCRRVALRSDVRGRRAGTGAVTRRATT